jgi:cytochrome c peroxidase
MSRRTAAVGLACLPLVFVFAADPPPVPKDTLPESISLDTLPLGLSNRPVPKGNPLTAKRVALGRKLFFDPILSADKTVACATCHQPDLGFAGWARRPSASAGRKAPAGHPP